MARKKLSNVGSEWLIAAVIICIQCFVLTENFGLTVYMGLDYVQTGVSKCKQHAYNKTVLVSVPDIPLHDNCAIIAVYLPTNIL